MRERLKIFRDRLNSWWLDLRKKQKLAVIDSDDDSEKWHMFISPVRIILGLVVLLVVMFGVVALTVVYSPVADTLPGYPGNRSREMLIAGIQKLDSLEREMANLTVYSDNIDMIMEGKTPVVRDVSRIGDSIEMIGNKTTVRPSAADSALRARMEGTGSYGLASSVAATRSLAERLDLAAPAQGLISSSFDPVHGRFGVDIATTANHPVVAVREGSVILSVWSPDEGNIVQIQHSDNLVSVYKRISGVTRNVGSRVKRGEVIGTAGASAGESGAAGPLEFELWYNGTPVNPENYIVF
jgi:murein DD-endopeptidase MepM/ murein hydrolase activator NlpD